MKQELEKFNDAFRTLKLISERKYYAQTQRQKNPTTWELIKSSKSTKYNRQKESMELLKYIHGGDEAAVFGAWDALCRLASPNQMEEFMLDYKKGKWFEKLYGKFSNIYHKSDDAMNQAIATKYKLQVYAKYTFMCKIQKSMYDVDSQTWRKKVINYGDRNITLCEKPISHKSVEQFVKQLDIGDIHSPIGLCGAFRTVTALVTMIIDLHLKTDLLRKKLIWFNGIQNHFIMEFSDDDAPETRELTMCIGTISCWNFGTRICSRDYHYPLHTISGKETDEVISQLWKQHTEEMQLIEGNLFYINNEKVTIQFEPSADQAWQFWANNELTQSANYPSMFARVHKSELTFIGGSIGNTEDDCKWKVPTSESRNTEDDCKWKVPTSESRNTEDDCKWKVPTSESRNNDLVQLNIKRDEMKKKELFEANFHRKELEFMADNGLRQLGPPRIGIFADRQRPEPLHLEVNNWSHILSIIYQHALQEGTFDRFLKKMQLSVESGGVGLKPICPAIKQHHDTDRTKTLCIRLFGEQAIKLARYSFHVIDVLIKDIENTSAYRKLKLGALAKICEALRNVGALMNSVSCDNTYVERLSESCALYFNLFSLFFKDYCNSTVWTIGYVVPYHAKLLYEQYNVGHGILSMQGKESKHSAFKQELKMESNRSNVEGDQGKWHQLARVSYFYLLYHFPVEAYVPHYRSRYPPVADNVCGCYRPLNDLDIICQSCCDTIPLVDDAKNRHLSDNLTKIVHPIECTECNAKFADMLMLAFHSKAHCGTAAAGTVDYRHVIPRNMKISELKEELKRRNLSTNGTKLVLIERLESCLL